MAHFFSRSCSEPLSDALSFSLCLILDDLSISDRHFSASFQRLLMSLPISNSMELCRHSDPRKNTQIMGCFAQEYSDHGVLRARILRSWGASRKDFGVFLFDLVETMAYEDDTRG